MATESHEAASPEAIPGAPGQEPAGAAASGTATEHASGGLPQFDFAQWPGQIAWFLIVFFAMLAFIRLFAAPKIGGTIDAREAQIAGDIAEARRLKSEADETAKAAAAELAQTRAASAKLAQEASAKAQAEVAARLAEEEAKLAETTGKAEAAIAAARAKAMTAVEGIASETAKLIVEKLTGKAASPAEVAASRG